MQRRSCWSLGTDECDFIPHFTGHVITYACDDLLYGTHMSNIQKFSHRRMGAQICLESIALSSNSGHCPPQYYCKLMYYRICSWSPRDRGTPDNNRGLLGLTKKTPYNGYRNPHYETYFGKMKCLNHDHKKTSFLNCDTQMLAKCINQWLDICVKFWILISATKGIDAK